MSLKNHFKPAPKMRAMLNMGSLFDMANGRYYIGKNGESINNGGLSFYTGVGGKGNTFKSTLMHFMVLVILNRYKSAISQIYDTEMSLTLERMYQLAQHLLNIAGVDLEAEDRIMLTDGTAMKGDEWFEAMKAFLAERSHKDNRKSHMRTTPFVDRETGKFFEMLAPVISEVDSLSMFITSAVQNIFDKAEIGNSASNTGALRDAAVKTQMLNQLPTLTAANSLYQLHSAHVGKQHQLDMYAPPARQLAFLKGQSAFKNVPEKFSFLPNNLYYVHSAEVLLNADKSGCEFPKDKDDKRKGDTDLQLLTVQNLRAKAGPTGMPFELIVSQNEGLLMSLSEFNFIKSLNRFGLQGNMQNYQLELYPEENLSRTTIRGKLDSNEKLCRAMEITAELAYMFHLGYRTENTIERGDSFGEDEILDRDLACTAKELYDDLIAKGYDWNVLLDTRGYWVFEEDTAGEKPFLSTMDLLRMRAGLYHPYWLPKQVVTKSDVKLVDVDNTKAVKKKS